MTIPPLGTTVYYRAKTRGYLLPAIVTATVDTLDPEGVRLNHVPALTSGTHVHLNVHTCGAQVTYQEHDVPEGDGPGTWHWPTQAARRGRLASP